MADTNRALEQVREKFRITELNALQKEVITHFVSKKTDLFVNFPMRHGKSFIYQALLLVFDVLHNASGHIAVLILLLINRMKDQVKKLTNLGVSAATLSDICEEKVVFEAIVFGSPEASLKIECWQKVLSSNVYLSKLCSQSTKPM